MTEPQEPDAELRDIALKAAARSAAIADLGVQVKELTTSVVSLRTEVAGAVNKDELRQAQRRAIWPLVVIAVSVLALVGSGVFVSLTVNRLRTISGQNRANGNYLVSCTTPPADNSPKEIKAHDCYVRLRSDPAQANIVHQLVCVDLLSNAVAAPMCDDVRSGLAQQGVKWPGP